MLKAISLGLCVFIALRANASPNSSNNAMHATNIEVSSEDLLQDRNIEELDRSTDKRVEAINKHLEATDARVQEHWEAMRTAESNIASIQAEKTVWIYVLGLALSGSIFFHVKGKKAAL